MQETQAGDEGSIPGSGKIPLEEDIATHSSLLAWRIPWTEGPGGQQSKGCQRIRYNLATELSPSKCSENSMKT